MQQVIAGMQWYHYKSYSVRFDCYLLNSLFENYGKN